MKYSFMTFSARELTLDELLLAAKKFGYDGVEPRLGFHKHGIQIETDAAGRAMAKDKAAAAGIEISCLGSSRQYANPDTEKEEIEITHQVIDLAADVGSPAVRVFGGKLPEGMEREAGIVQLVKCLTSVADHAAERGVTLCMETHDHWCEPQHVAEVMRRVNHSAVGVNWDIAHPINYADATIDSSFEAFGKWVRHCHIHDGKTQADGKYGPCPIGEGNIDHRRLIQLLMGATFTGHMSGEWFAWEPPEVYLPREVAALRRFERELAARPARG